MAQLAQHRRCSAHALALSPCVGLHGEYHHGKEVTPGKVEEKHAHPRRWLNGEVAEDGGVRWSLNGDDAPVNSGGRRRVPELLGVE
jgi:hypothetical protein